jgi:hypothetical protein
VTGAPDYFRFPSGRLCRLHRAICYDSWLMWRHALPEDQVSWALLRQPQVHAIGRLARLLHPLSRAIARKNPGTFKYFRVMQWWDPHHPDWSSGRRILLHTHWMDASEALTYLDPDHVRGIVRGGGTAEILLLRYRAGQERLVRSGAAVARPPQRPSA